MRLSTSDDLIHHEGYTHSYIEIMERLHKAGFRVLDLNLTDYQHDGSPFNGENWRFWLEQIKKRADELGIIFTQSHAPVYPFAEKEHYNEHMEDMMHRAFIACGETHIPWLVIHISRPVNMTLEETIKLNTEYFKRMLIWAHKYNVGIAIENLPQNSNTSQKEWSSMFLSSPEALLSFVKGFNDDKIGVCIDVGHAMVQGWKIPYVIDLMGSDLKALHIQDGNGISDQHLPPYFGKMNWIELMEALKRNKYSGDFTYEVCFPMRFAPTDIQDKFYKLLVELGEKLVCMGNE